MGATDECQPKGENYRERCRCQPNCGKGDGLDVSSLDMAHGKQLARGGVPVRDLENEDLRRARGAVRTWIFPEADLGIWSTTSSLRILL